MENFLLALEDDNITGMLAAEDGYKVELNAVDGPNSGRDLTGTMHRDKVGDKVKIYCKCRGLINDTEAGILFPHLKQTYITVRFFNPFTGSESVKQMYCSQMSASFVYRKRDGTRWYKDVSFNLIER